MKLIQTFPNMVLRQKRTRTQVSKCYYGRIKERSTNTISRRNIIRIHLPRLTTARKPQNPCEDILNIIYEYTNVKIPDNGASYRNNASFVFVLQRIKGILVLHLYGAFKSVHDDVKILRLLFKLTFDCSCGANYCRSNSQQLMKIRRNITP